MRGHLVNAPRKPIGADSKRSDIRAATVGQAVEALYRLLAGE